MSVFDADIYTIMNDPAEILPIYSDFWSAYFCKYRDINVISRNYGEIDKNSDETDYMDSAEVMVRNNDDSVLSFISSHLDFERNSCIEHARGWSYITMLFDGDNNAIILCSCILLMECAVSHTQMNVIKLAGDYGLGCQIGADILSDVLQQLSKSSDGDPRNLSAGAITRGKIDWEALGVTLPINLNHERPEGWEEFN
jgi:hypothetical protein